MMSMAHPTPAGSSNKLEVQETTAWAERRLRDGSNLKYRLTILQQPERARACGQGAKSHADRRPVDPPPVVELRLFQGDDQNDVTFSFNSNFFLFATLEPARPIANGRVVTAPAQAPVLTGVPVSGMAYLDRPAPAGYFIFPDLSVRHEGKYRLHFALFEECKEEGDTQGMQQEVTHFRLEVKSKPFTVFSAKKFPGLAESTALSRIVAEQGCRVRIRRDVRMRRRPEKPNREDDRMEDGNDIRRREAVPQEKREGEYSRPASNYNERPSYSQQPSAPQPQNNGHLSFSSNPPPGTHIAPPPSAPQSWHAQQEQAQQQAPAQPQQSAPSAQSDHRRESGEYNYQKRQSDGYRYSQTQQPYTAPSQYSAPSQNSSHRNSRDDLPPLKLAALEPRLPGGLNSPSASTPSGEFIGQRPSSSQLPSPSTYNGSSSTSRTSSSAASAPSFSATNTYNSGPPSWSYPDKLVAAPEPAPRHAGSKRSWDRVFNDSHVRDRLQNGMRPNQANYGIDPEDDDEDDFDYSSLRMSYRRADGVQIVRSLPDETD